MIGAIFGDIIGSYYELCNVKREDFELFVTESNFTDDTIMTLAICETLLNSDNDEKGLFTKKKRAEKYALHYKMYYKRYPYAGFGQMFSLWASSNTISPQKSYGNGGAMRVIPIAYAFDSLEKVQEEAKISCMYTHKHKVAIKGAQAIATTVFLARMNNTKAEIKSYIEKKYNYNLNFTLDNIRENYIFDSKTSYCVPPAIVAFLESSSYEDAIRKAISIGGDSDTIACMTGGIAEAYYKEIPNSIYEKCWSILDIGMKTTIKAFNEKYNIFPVSPTNQSE